MFKNSKAGFLLIETVIATMLVGVILAFSFTVLFWSNKSFKKAQQQAILQEELQQKAKNITEEVRRATNVDVRNNPVGNDVFQQIYLQDNAIIFTSKPETSKQEVDIVDLHFKMETIPENKHMCLIHFYIKGVYKDQSHKLESTVLAEQLTKTVGNSEKDGPVLLYQSS